MRSLLARVSLLVGLMLVACVTSANEPICLHVATNGNDSWSGQLPAPNETQTDGPLATLYGARDAIRGLRKRADEAIGGVRVLVQSGLYTFGQPLELTAIDSGSERGPIVYQAAPSATVRLLGGKVVTKWQPVASTAVLNRLDPSAREAVLQVDLKALKVTDFGSPGGGGMELFFNQKPVTVARWPNEGFVRIAKVLGKTERNVRGTKGCAEGIFQYQEDRPKRWLEEEEAWVHGYWFWDWAEQRHPIKSIDVAKQTLEVKPPYHGYGYRKGQWFYAFNLLSEIDQPGEWYLERKSGKLYFWPPAAIDGSETVISVLPTLVTMKDVSHVTLSGFTIEGVRGTAVTISGGQRNRVLGCIIRNAGRRAVAISGGTEHGIAGCDIYQMGGGGVSLSGGNRTTLQPARHFAENNHIHHFARVQRVYQPGISLQGVGLRATRNLIHNAPHMAMGFGGNDHVIELNEIHSVCYESNDAGAIYSGRNWTTRGTVIRHNFLHHINGFEGRGCVGVYLDDMYSGTEISGNLFYRVTQAAFIGGGRDCLVANNLFVDCKPAMHIDARAMGWAKYHAETWVKEGREKGTLLGIRFNKPPYSTRYPQLLNILDDEPFAPKGNRVVHNISYGGKWDGIQSTAKKFVTLKDNLLDVDPHFISPERIGPGKQPCATDFQLKEDSPAWAIGIKKLPLAEIGLYEDPHRASWPVVHEVRPE